MKNAILDIIEHRLPDRELAVDDTIKVVVAGHPISIGAFSLDTHARFVAMFGLTLYRLRELLGNLEFPESKVDLPNLVNRWLLALNTPRVYRQILKILELTLFREPGNEWWRRHKRWFRKHVTVQQLTDVFLYVYLANWECVKKNVTFLLRRAGIAATTETYWSSSAQNLGGQIGKHVRSRFDGLPSISSDGRKLVFLKKPPVPQGEAASGNG